MFDRKLSAHSLLYFIPLIHINYYFVNRNFSYMMGIQAGTCSQQAGRCKSLLKHMGMKTHICIKVIKKRPWQTCFTGYSCFFFFKWEWFILFKTWKILWTLKEPRAGFMVQGVRFSQSSPLFLTANCPVTSLLQHKPGKYHPQKKKRLERKKKEKRSLFHTATRAFTHS